MSDVLRRKEIIILIGAFAGFMVIGDYFLTLPTILSDLSKDIVTWGLITANFAFILGLVNLSRSHIINIQKRTSGSWAYSVVLMAVLILMIMVGIFLGQDNEIYSWLFTNGLLPLDATMYSILGYFIASGAFRAFRARNLDSGLLIGAAIVVMLTNAPIGVQVWSGFPVIGKWIMRVPVTAGMRAIIIGVGVGSLTYAIRVLIGRETRYAGVGQNV
jgi:hypothetical protein